jgi:hypothetical protein
VDFLLSVPTILAATHAVIVIAIALRVIMRRPDTGVALAWLLLVTILPFAGAVAYLLIGERRIGHRRKRGIATLRIDYRKIAEAAVREGLTDVDWSRRPPAAVGMDRLGTKSVGFPSVRGSRFRMFSDTQKMLQSIAADVDAAKTSVLMEFYIWNEGGSADEVLEAVIRAAQRGVSDRQTRSWRPSSGRRSEACPAVCSSTRWGPARGGRAGSHSGFATPASTCSRPCRSGCFGRSWAERICVCTARSSLWTATWRGREA